ncbi:MAG: phosphotransferase, partial [Hungatella sp.]
ANRGGQVLTGILWEGQIYDCMMSEFLTGEMPHPQSGKKSMAEFEQVGEIAATLHRQAMGWEEGKTLNRPIWDYETLLGEKALFGNWRQCPDLDLYEFDLLDRTCAMIREHLTAYGRDEHNFGLIHSDLRAANLLIEGDQMKVLDFDDCGYGWHLQDLAASISFLEEDPYAVAWMEAWIVGYQRILPFRKRERDEIATFVMARRIQLLALITSHEDSDPVHNLYEGFAKGTCRMAEKYLLSFDHLKTTVSGGRNRTL